MNDNRKRTEHSLALPLFASFVCMASLLSVGLLGPVFREMYLDFKVDQAGLFTQFVQATHWMWTVPLGLIISAVLVIGAGRWPQKTNANIDIAAIVFAVILFLGFGYMAMQPIFD